MGDKPPAARGASLIPHPSGAPLRRGFLWRLPLKTADMPGKMRNVIAPRLARVSALLVFAALSLPGYGQAYPAKPLRMIVPFPPGGAADLPGRLVGQKLSERVGQPVVVETRPGGGGVHRRGICGQGAARRLHDHGNR